MSTIQQGRSLAILYDVLSEKVRQRKEWNEESLSLEGLSSLLGKGCGDICQAVREWRMEGNQHTMEFCREELIDLAAVAVQMVECLDRYHLEMKNEPGKNQGSKIRSQEIPQEG